jgi:hypothetical protein
MTTHHKKISRAVTFGWHVALCLVILQGCSTNPIPHERLQQPELVAIAQAYQRTVQEAYNHHETRWHSGPIGNMVVNYWGEPNAGLCYQWQQLVFQGIQQQVHQLGWQSIGIRINKGTDHEHHAVVVFDPNRIQRNELLEKAESSEAYVLDPWRSGQADIYALSDWLLLPRVIEIPAQLKELKVKRDH